MDRKPTSPSVATVERLLAGRVVLTEQEVSWALAKELRQRFQDTVWYLYTITNPPEIRPIKVGELADELAKALARQVREYEPPVAACVDEKVIGRARATLERFGKVDRAHARLALAEVLDEAARLRLLLGDMEARLNAIGSGPEPREGAPPPGPEDRAALDNP